MEPETIRDKLITLETRTGYVIAMLEKMEIERENLRDNLTRFAEVIRKEQAADVKAIHDKIEGIKVEISDLKVRAALTAWVGAAIATITLTIIGAYFTNDHKKEKSESSRPSIGEVIPRRPGGISAADQIQSKVRNYSGMVQGTRL